ncbi:MAG TPA: type II secretion system minor pseudopilin GspK [Gammaproteobacteria bacterium]|jgi:general secretion pathway protein K|nr:type II secretion system minor pseudopilin GspK [Gammaproteobacteria bacterium]
MLLLHRNIKSTRFQQRQRGIVLVVALFIVALVATMAYVMLAQLERDTRRTTLLLRNTQAELYAQGSIAWAMDQLRQNLEKQQPNQIVDKIPLQLPVVEIAGYRISSKIEDMQGRFNLNNLTQTDEQTQFKRLLQQLAPDLTEEKVSAIVAAIVDWITSGTENSAESHYYLTLPQPYRAAHRPMVSMTELRLVKGMTADLFNALQPYVVALPKATKINVQTAPAAVLMLLSPTLELATTQALLQLRAQQPWISAQTFLNVDLVKNHSISADKITFVSDYFLIETVVSIEKQQRVLYTLLERGIKDKKVVMTVHWQTK